MEQSGSEVSSRLSFDLASTYSQTEQHIFDSCSVCLDKKANENSILYQTGSFRFRIVCANAVIGIPLHIFNGAWAIL